MRKYIPVFGDQSMFDGGPEDAEMVNSSEKYLRLHRGVESFNDETATWEYYGDTTGSKVVAMRRIEETLDDGEGVLESLYWEFDSQRAKKTTDERLLFKGKLRYYADLVAGKGENAEPKHWTVADQKAGRPPYVGYECIYKNNHLVTFLVLYIDDEFICLKNSNGTVFTILICDFIKSYKPIETPDEKAARLEDEWVNKAWSETAVFGGVTQDENDRLKIHLRHIYRAQLSGELSAPV
jgi:hypothetical protein